METISRFVEQWGYIAVFLGSLVEGESVVLTASAFAYIGTLSLYKVMLVAFCGTWIADQILYTIGRRFGSSLFDRFPKLKPGADKAFTLLKKWDAGFIIACRFIYGIRTTSCIVVGAAGIPPKRFVPLNTLSAIIWVIVSCTGGYFLGPLMEKIFNNLYLVQKYFILFIVFTLLIAGSVLMLKKRRKSKIKDQKKDMTEDKGN